MFDTTASPRSSCGSGTVTGMSSSHASRGSGVGLLCELHAHSRWSDGELELPDVVDLYGRAGFDVLCMTDHVVRDGDMVSADAFPAYRLAIAEQALRAWDRYRMVVIPGLELTWDDPDDCACGACRGDRGRSVHRARGRAGRGARDRSRPGRGDHRRPSAWGRWRRHARPHHPPLVARRRAALARAPLRADQPLAGVRVGGVGRRVGHRQR